jgi:osmoprotectant transport system permease protein
LLVTVLALLLDGLLALAVWASVPGTGRFRRMPQPLLDDEVSFDAHAPAARMGRSTRPGYERGGPSHTVDG